MLRLSKYCAFYLYLYIPLTRCRENNIITIISTATYKFQFWWMEDLCLFYTPIPCNFVYKNCAKGIDWSMCEGTLGPTVRLQGVIQPTPVPNSTVICIVQQNW